MRIFRRLAQSLAFKIGSTIVIAEIFVLLLTGILYVSTFSTEIDLRIAGQAQLPGKLMQAGLLKFNSIADEKTMRDLVGDELLNGLVVGTNRNVFYSLNPTFLGKSVEDLPGIETSLFQANIGSGNLLQREQKLISISPLYGTDNRTLRFYVYVETSLAAAQQQKANLVQVFFIGSLVTVLLTFLILYVAFNRTVFSRLRHLLGVIKQVETGNLAARVTDAPTGDEIGTLQKGVNSMIGRLQEIVGTLEQRVRERTKELEIARQVAESASNTKSVFLSNMSHELRTPLNMVLGYASSMLNMPQMYNNQTLPEVFRSDVQLIQENGKYLLSLINDILDLSKIEADKLVLDYQVTNLPELLRGVIATSLGLVKEKPLQIRPDFSDDLPLVWVDPLRVRQILLNLMSNAVKFTESGSITLSAKMSGEKVRISVTDTGIGIPQKALASIFDRYEQIKGHVEGKHSGTGLGLDISQRLSHMHGSQLTVTSEIGRGSTFTFELVCATAQQIAAPQRIAPVVDTGFKILKHEAEELPMIRQIVVVDDSSDERLSIRQALEDAGHIVTETSDGTQLLSLAQGILPDAIISSMPLPGVNLWSILDSLKAQPETEATPIILLTDATVQKVDKPGVVYLSKPVTPDAIVSQVNRLFN